MSILDKKGRNTKTDLLAFSNPNASTLITGPTAEFLRGMHKAFGLDACYVRYGSSVNRTYKRFVIFVVQGIEPAGAQMLASWIAYLRTHQDPKNEDEFLVL